MQALAFVDLETSGSVTGTDRITEIGIVTVDIDGTVKTWEKLINPETFIPPFIQQLTGINNEMVADAPVFADVASEVQKLLADRLLIAHNARFDYGFLRDEFKRLNIHFHARTLCTVKLSRSLFPEHKKHNLDALIERHDLQAEARHRALADAKLIHQFWQKIHVDRDIESIQSAITALNPHPNLPVHLESAVDDLPSTAGRYRFLDEQNRLLYENTAKNIRKRVLSHFSGKPRSPREAGIILQVKTIEWSALTTL